MRMPLPPPPADALIITGKPISSAMRAASASSSTTPMWPGTVDTLALAANFFDSILSPIARMASAWGPMNTMPAAAARPGTAGSDRKP
jgi:hypothetical protein